MTPAPFDTQDAGVITGFIRKPLEHSRLTQFSKFGDFKFVTWFHVSLIIRYGANSTR